MRHGWVLLAAAVAGCDGGAPAPPRTSGVRGEAHLIKVVHVLVAFKGAKDAPDSVRRTQAEAGALANEVLARARGGEDMQKLVKEYSTDPATGTYFVANHGTPALGGQKRRSQLVAGFTKVAFALG